MPYTGLTLSHSDGSIETLTFFAAEPDEDELDFEFYYCEDNMHPNVPLFVSQRHQWLLLIQTDRGHDNGYGLLYMDPAHGFICAEDSWDDRRYALNAARDMEHIMELWEQYSQIGKPYEGGFVDWIMEGVTSRHYCDMNSGNDPFL